MIADGRTWDVRVRCRVFVLRFGFVFDSCRFLRVLFQRPQFSRVIMFLSFRTFSSLSFMFCTPVPIKESHLHLGFGPARTTQASVSTSRCVLSERVAGFKARHRNLGVYAAWRRCVLEQILRFRFFCFLFQLRMRMLRFLCSRMCRLRFVLCVHYKV